MGNFFKTFAFAVTLVALPLRAETEDAPATLAPAEQFALLASWEGSWQVAEAPALRIVFEKTARGSVVVERWETPSGLHSMTVYNMDGDALVATHYCPQGNQPRLESRRDGDGEIRLRFRDATDLDAGESHAHELWFKPGPDGTIRRFEAYRGQDGLHEPNQYTLSRTSPEN